MPRPRKPSRAYEFRDNRYSMSNLPRRLFVIFGLAAAIALVIVFSLPSSNSSTLDQLRASYKQSAQQAKQFFKEHDGLPALYNPFAHGKDAQRPADQDGARHRGVQWYEDDIEWRTQFSSLVTLDTERVVLPTLPERTSIYTYYDSGSKPADVVQAEQLLLQAWRQAWWAQGLRPVVLGKSDAHKEEKLWQTLQRSNIASAIKSDLEGLLAWSQVGGGILASYLAFPMAPRKDPFLSKLRQGSLPDEAVKIGSLSTGMLFADIESLGAALKLALADEDDLAQAKELEDVPGMETFQTPSHKIASIAVYDPPSISLNYKPIADKLASSGSEGLGMLRDLINAHLQSAWQSQYPSGISITKPHPEHMTELSSYAADRADLLSSCPDNNPLPDSCPPNNLKCQPCSAEHHLPLSLSEHFKDQSDLFHIITVAHPLTFTSLDTATDSDQFTSRFIRRKTLRDQWISTFTTNIVSNSKIGAAQRLLPFKELITNASTAHDKLILLAEQSDHMYPSYILGFDLSLPRDITEPSKLQAQLHKSAALRETLQTSKDRPLKDEKSEERRVAKKVAKLTPSDADLASERGLIKQAKKYLMGAAPKEKKVRDMVEAWNLADTEAWRFVRAVKLRKEKEWEEWRKVEGIDGESVI
ncbi:MAG: hypothetical protein Q9159_005867 [Coniocarpon cinnabarinum]